MWSAFKAQRQLACREDTAHNTYPGVGHTVQHRDIFVSKCALARQVYDRRMYLSGITDAFKNIFFPKYCLGCKKVGTLLCDDCWSRVEYIYAPICPVCRGQSVAGLTHAGCRTPQGLDGLISLAYYRGPIKNLVRQLKYQGATVTQELILQLIQTYLQHESFYWPPAIITSVPLHVSSRNKRGFNQADTIAQALSTQTKLPFVPDVLQRHLQTPSQTKLSKEQRQTNVRGAFSLNSTESIKGASFILVDDVFTTGATLREATKILKRAGAKQVFAFTLAQD